MGRLPVGPIHIDGLHRHFGAGGIVGLVLLAILWAVIIAALVLGIRALILHNRRDRAAYTVGGPAVAASGPGGAYTGTATPVQTGTGRSANASATLTILEERYARGEIDRDQFLQQKQDLGLIK